MFGVVLLAFALSADASAAAFSYGLIFKKNIIKNAILLSFATGLGQFLFPIIGWFATKSVYKYIEVYDHWLAFFVFLALGINIIIDALSEKKDNDKHHEILSFSTLFMIGVATSIDACVAGITLYFMPINIFVSALVIGIVCFVCSFCAFLSTCCFQKFPTKYLQISAGIIMIFLGCKVLYEHLS
ncbi:MAG: manganese efflux pump [Alphaproteobacteria bacterium]|nr:manganese efflux pump [Alphaproteobacteria bacterium]